MSACSSSQAHPFLLLESLYLAAFRLPCSSILLYNNYMILGFKTQLKVNQKQRTLLAQHAGTARHAWNQEKVFIPQRTCF